MHIIIKYIWLQKCYHSRMGFERRRKGKYKVVGKFVERIWKIQEEAKAVLKKTQDEIKKFVNRK